MAISNRKKIEAIQDSDEVKSHALYPHIQNARLKILNGNFSDLLHALHQISGMVNDKTHVVKKNDAMHYVIRQLFVDAKKQHSDPARCNEIRMKQATFLEHMDEDAVALAIFDSLSKKDSSQLRWAAMNSRTWLLRELGRFDEALASVNELINLSKNVSIEQKPRARRLRDANKLKAGIERLINERDATAVIEPVRNEVKVSVATAYATQFSMPVRKNVKSNPELKAAPETKSLVQKLF